MSQINSNRENTQLQFADSTSFYQKWRLIKDHLTRYGVIAGGLGVIIAIVLIFFYLLYVVFPLFLPAAADPISQYETPEPALGRTLLLAMEEQNEVGVRFTENGKAVFFEVETGTTLDVYPVAVPADVTVTSFAHGSPTTGVVAYGLSDGRAIVVKHKYKVTYPNDVRLITPLLEYPLGEEPVLVDSTGSALQHIAIKMGEDLTTLIAKTSDQRIVLTGFEKEESLFDDDAIFERSEAFLEIPSREISYILLDKEQRNLYLASSDGRLSYVDVSKKTKPAINQHLNIVAAGEKITSLEFLNGDLSLLVGDSSGLVSQWSLVRDDQNRPALQKLRTFKLSDDKIIAVVSEQRRKGFIAVDADGTAAIFHSTAERELIRARVTSAIPPKALALSPRANAFLLQDAKDQLHYWHIDNEHPEVSLKSIWREVWYESYPKPAYTWQSSSASNDFEPKFSLTPLVFGTLKAAFYAMLMAIPLAIMGAIYTAYFMAPRMRRLVKPSIEIMEALPTVILGFLAGLWLAPMVEESLAGVFALLIIVPLAVILFAFAWQKLPEKFTQKIPEGWDAALLIPVIIIASWLAFELSHPIQDLLFGGDLRTWLTRELGIGYDQRNSLVVGLAMGFAVIPTIFSIAEDAIFSVPKHLTFGSLALGATPWQTMMKVVLLTASPGIFSAVMIGFGRAVGETMIVLMATGNTPVMDLSIFQGMRTLSANIAVEMPESEVDSTHYRVLFLAALVLFLFTFVFNTLAEIIRQRLREKYSSL